MHADISPMFQTQPMLSRSLQASGNNCHHLCFYHYLPETLYYFLFLSSSQYIARLHLKTEHFGKLLDQVYNADCLSLHLSSSIMLSRHNVSATSLSRVCVPFVWSYSKCVGEVG